MDSVQRTNIEKKLKNCPFCGGRPYFEASSRGFVDGQSTRVTYVRCRTCNARTSKYNLRGNFTSSEARQLAIDSWNIRWES